MKIRHSMLIIIAGTLSITSAFAHELFQKAGDSILQTTTTTLQIGSSGTARTANKANIIFYYNSTCGSPGCSNSGMSSTNGYLFSPNHNVTIDAAGLAAIANTATPINPPGGNCITNGTIHSIAIMPMVSPSTNVLTGYACITINNGCTGGQCTSSQSTTNVTLAS